MFIIKRIQIDGFWGASKIDVSLNDDVNIFIGVNGSGKTTFINLVESTLSGDIPRLSTYRFKTIRINLVDGNHKRSIVVEKHEPIEQIIVRIGTFKYHFELLYLRSQYRASYIHPVLDYNYQSLKEKLNEILGLTYLSVHRNTIKQDNDKISDDNNALLNPVDNRLTDLMSKLTTYQLKLQSSVNDLSKEFQQSILKLMLFNKDYDSVNVNAPININLDKLKRGLLQAYRDLDLLDDEQKQNINYHIEEIKNAAEKINQYNRKETQAIYVNDISALTLMKRTEKIAELSSELEQKRNYVFEPINSYIKLLTEDFVQNKELKFSTNSQGSLVFSKGRKEYNTSQLSSGEKQLLILFTESLLQTKRRFIFIADEPELSLHISWQRKIIPTLKSLNPNAQLLLATHSPEIVGPLVNKTINMEDIIF